MPNKLAKPTSPGRRRYSLRDFSSITNTAPTKSLLQTVKKTGGRNNQGRITVRHIGGGHKRRLRIIDFLRREPKTGVVKHIEYDPNRSSFIALVEYSDNTKGYILAAKDMVVGTKIENGEKTAISVGNSLMLKNIPTGIAIHNVELTVGKGASMVRSAGLYATLMAHEGNQVVIKLPSGELRRMDDRCYATIGEVSNASHENLVIGKAGRKRWMGIRPTVRGKAMNPNTHPHGGGEGNTSIGMKYPKTPWGAIALGHKTRDRNRPSSTFIMRKRSK